MNISLVRHNCCQPKLRNLKPGTLVRHEGHIYIKLDKLNSGVGIDISWPNGHTILMNLKSGRCRSVDALIAVSVLQQCEELEAYIIEDKAELQKYLR